MGRAKEWNGNLATIAGLARACGVARSTVQEWMRDPTFPKEQDGVGWSLFEVGRWHGIRQVEKKQKENLTAAEGDPLLVGDNGSPGLERYRAAKASLAELDLAERENRLVDFETMRSVITTICLTLRGGLEELQRSCGPIAHKVMDDCLREAKVRIDELFGPDNREGEDECVG